jgi:hypothetical protein
MVGTCVDFVLIYKFDNSLSRLVRIIIMRCFSSISDGNGWGWQEEKETQSGWRRRRDVESTASVSASVPEMSAYDPSLDEVLQYDQLGCGMRLVCELSASPAEALFDDERLILELFG